MESEGEDAFSLAPRSQEGSFHLIMKFALLYLAEGSNRHVL